MKIIFYIIFSFLCYIPAISATENVQGQEPNNEFQRIDKEYVIKYRKMEPSGCFTEISLRNNSSVVLFSYGDYFCRKAAKERIETIPEIAESISKIIAHYQLEEEIRTRKFLHIGISICEKHLIRYINNDETWPKDIYSEVDEIYNQEKVNFIYELTRKEIIKSKIYDPFISIMNKIGCKINLSKIFVEGISNKNIALTKKNLLKWGIINNDEIKKERYPSFKGPITFDLTYDENAEL